MNAAIIKTSTGFDYRRVVSSRQSEPTCHPNYAARRVGAVLAAVFAAVVMAALLNGVLASFSGLPAQAAGAPPAAMPDVPAESARATHVARSGDSLWSIANEHRGGVDRDRYIDALVSLNGDTSIVVGQAVVLP